VWGCFVERFTVLRVGNFDELTGPLRQRQAPKVHHAILSHNEGGWHHGTRDLNIKVKSPIGEYEFTGVEKEDSGKSRRTTISVNPIKVFTTGSAIDDAITITESFERDQVRVTIVFKRGWRGALPWAIRKLLNDDGEGLVISSAKEKIKGVFHV